MQDSSNSVALQEELEQTIAQLWCRIFHLERVGPDDNFFELGGNSLTGMQVAEGLAVDLGAQLPVVAVFLNPTIRELAQLIAAQ